MERIIGKHWHHLPDQEILELLDTDAEMGLDLFEVEHRQKQFGPNRLAAKQGSSALKRFLLQFNQPLIYILLTAALITLLLQEWVDAGVIMAVVLVNAIIGFSQESKAVKAIEALSKTMGSKATVIRAGKKQEIDADTLVPGDIVSVQSGDKIPADLRLINIRDLQVDESALTGESLPVLKKSGVLEKEAILADRLNMAYASALVTYGQGSGVVVATGQKTEVGRISQLISETEELQTPLTRKIAHFSHILLYVIIGLAVITMATGLLRGEKFVDMFMAAVALAVGAIPEGLPAAVTITLAIGVARMAKRRAIIRKLPAVETLGSTTVICSDKTGTLTQNQMTVREVVVAGKQYKFNGSGYQPVGKISLDDKEVQLKNHPHLEHVLRAGLLCNDSELENKDGQWNVQGDPTEGALIASAVMAGFDKQALAREFPRLDSIPFESEHQYMATLNKSAENGDKKIFIKGSIEAILERSAFMVDGSGKTVPVNTAEIIKIANQLSERGLRVLAFAYREYEGQTDKIDHTDVNGNLVFIGLQAMIDPPRKEAIEAVRVCQDAGIAVKMITGDHVLTAQEIGRQIGILAESTSENDKPAYTGKELADMSDSELIAAVNHASIFARVTPEQKLRLVEALQSQSKVVAMTGDGVNDAPALKKANIGVAMGISGTEVSKEASDIVLTDDNFASIEAAVEEGRGVFDNLTKFIVWTLPTNLGEGLVILAAIFAGVMLPILPLQILWINMTTAILLGLMLAFEPKEPGIMSRVPRDPNKPILTGNLIRRIFLVGGLMLVGAFSIFNWELNRGVSAAEARTAAVNVFIFVEMFYLFNSRSLTGSVFKIGFFSNPLLFAGVGVMFVLQMMFTYVPLFNTVFQSAPIGLEVWWRILLIAGATSTIVAIEKWMTNKFSGKKLNKNSLKIEENYKERTSYVSI